MFLEALKRALSGFILCLVCTVAPASASPPPILLHLLNCTVPATNVDSWGLSIELAHKSQSLCLSPSTVTNSTLVIGSDFCQNAVNISTAQCESLCGNTFNISLAEAFYKSSSPGAVLALNPVWDAISKPEVLLAGTTSMEPGLDNDLSNYPIGIITKGNHQNVGHLGLANGSDFLNILLSKDLIPANGFGLNAGSQSVEHPRDGGLVLGGYDRGSITGSWTEYPITTAASNSGRQCPLYVEITSLVIRFPQEVGHTEEILSSDGQLIPACIEPYDNLFRLPLTTLRSFQNATAWSADTLGDPTIYVAEPGLYYPYMAGFNGSLVFKLNNGVTVEIPNNELLGPLRGININGARVLTLQNITEVKIFSEAAALDTAVLGKVFLSQQYLSVDYTANQFKLATIAPNQDKDIVPFDPAPAKSTLSKGAIAGIAVGAVAVAVAILLSCLFRHRIRSYLSNRRGKAMANSQPPSAELPNLNQQSNHTLPTPAQQDVPPDDPVENLPQESPCNSISSGGPGAARGIDR